MGQRHIDLADTPGEQFVLWVGSDVYSPPSGGTLGKSSTMSWRCAATRRRRPERGRELGQREESLSVVRIPSEVSAHPDPGLPVTRTAGSLALSAARREPASPATGWLRGREVRVG